MNLIVVVVETYGEKLRSMLSIEFLMLQFKRCKCNALVVIIYFDLF